MAGTTASMLTAPVAIAEDDSAIRDLLVHHLEREGLRTVVAADGVAALRVARAGASMIVLDVGLPVVDGFEVARTLRREQREVPILFLTARTDEVDRVIGFELGADDYVCKPFSVREVVARVKAILRRNDRDRTPSPLLLRFGRLEIDEAAREVRLDGTDVCAKPREFALLLELASHPGVALSRRALLDRVWGFDYVGDERTIDVHVKRVREKIESSTRRPAFVLTVHGFGYKFVRP
ncbi:MAG TPA: response regulator transcription factor [Verrucomicrobiae bacterium]|nr:response regulator transcription factor [Verrucomicrobiae bacterium]